jgi:hypothetical protein
MRRTLLTLATATGLMGGMVGLGASGASAAPVTPLNVPVQASANIQQADWYCGPRCEYWRHRRWEERHGYWREHRYPYYGYNYNYGRGYPYPYYR